MYTRSLVRVSLQRILACVIKSARLLFPCQAIPALLNAFVGGINRLFSKDSFSFNSWMVVKMTYRNKAGYAILFYIWNYGTIESWNIGPFFWIIFISIMIFEIKQSWIENSLIEFLIRWSLGLESVPLTDVQHTFIRWGDLRLICGPACNGRFQ